MMGGNINFNSNEGLGSEFRCNFTLKRASSNNENPDSYQSIERANILIIAEISEKIEYIVSLLNRKKCNVNVVHPSKWQQHLDKIQDAGRIILEWKSYVTERPFFNHVATNEELSKKIVLLVSEYAKTELGSLLQLPNNLNINFIPEPFIPSDVYFVICKQQAKPMRISHTKQLVLKDSKTCLLVEDNETNQIIAADILTKIGFKVDLAENGFEAVNKAAKGKYDIILMDIHMPVMDGYEATRIIRKIDPSIPIVGLTASVLEKDKKDSSNAGFNFHLGKPINLQELDVVVSNYFEVKYLEQEGGEAGREVEPAEEANEHKILNMKYLNETFSDKEFIRILLLSFLETYDSIDTDWSNTDANSEDARVKVHTLKGVTGNLHIHKIHEEAKTFEIQIGSSSKKEILDNLIRLVVSLNKEIKEELSH
jgi:CheY-like chemotaxis protein